MEMSKERIGEIAYALIKAKAKKDGVRYDLIKRELGQVSKDVGVSPEELMEFMRLLNLELHEETFKPPRKSAERKPGIPGPDNPFFYLNK
ncbi:MAG TPA: hypothetical protein VK254_02405 [Candidatus Bathyarchaeia archaeon]|nr:hypothetical protein [Candidatus Bathyarchaeia archaeon]